MLVAPVSGRDFITKQAMGDQTSPFTHLMLLNCETGARDPVETRISSSWTLLAQQGLTIATSRTCWLQRACWALIKYLWPVVEFQKNWYRSMLRTMSSSLSNLPSQWLRWEIFLLWLVQGVRSERTAEGLTNSRTLYKSSWNLLCQVLCILFSKVPLLLFLRETLIVLFAVISMLRILWGNFSCSFFVCVHWSFTVILRRTTIWKIE